MKINSLSVSNNTYNNKNQKQQSFSGSLSSKIVGNGTLGKYAKSMNFDSCNMPFPALVSVMGVGVILPRLIQAQDKYDREEILRRDVISCAVMLFGEKALSKTFSKMNEMKSGFVLADKGKDFAQKNVVQKVFDYIRPEKGVRVLNSNQLTEMYSNIDGYKNGVVGFCEDIAERGGNLKKIFSLTDKAKNSVVGLVGQEAFENADNNTIINGIKKGVEEGSEHVKNLVNEFADKANPFVNKAKALNSRFKFLSMVVLIPATLGFLIPKVNERITKKKFLANQSLQGSDAVKKAYQHPCFMATAGEPNRNVFKEFSK